MEGHNPAYKESNDVKNLSLVQKIISRFNTDLSHFISENHIFEDYQCQLDYLFVHLVKENIINDENFESICEILQSIIQYKPIIEFDSNLIFDFLIVASEIFPYITFQYKEYVSHLTLYLLIRIDSIDRKIIIDEYSNYFHAIFEMDETNYFLLFNDDSYTGNDTE